MVSSKRIVYQIGKLSNSSTIKAEDIPPTLTTKSPLFIYARVTHVTVATIPEMILPVENIIAGKAIVDKTTYGT